MWVAVTTTSEQRQGQRHIVHAARKEADMQAYALEASLKPLSSLDPKALQVLAASHTDPRVTIAQALRDLASDASKIGQLNITPYLLTSLLKK